MAKLHKKLIFAFPFKSLKFTKTGNFLRSNFEQIFPRQVFSNLKKLNIVIIRDIRQFCGFFSIKRILSPVKVSALIRACREFLVFFPGFIRFLKN